MCEPATILAVTAIASTAFTVQSQRRQARHQEGVTAYNARVAENEAEAIRSKGAEEENIQRRRTAELLSKQRAQLGASGVELTSGSALQLQEDTAMLGEIDAMRIRSNFQAQAASLETGASLTRGAGASAADVTRSRSVGTLLSGTSDVLGTGVADKWFTPNSAANQTTFNVTGDQVNTNFGNIA